MRELLFLNPELKKGINVTVRRGLKWLGYSLVEPVVIKDTESGDEVGKGLIVGRLVLNFSEIPDEVLALEHDSSCTTLDGLYDAMVRAYPDFKTTDICTILFFKVE